MSSVPIRAGDFLSDLKDSPALHHNRDRALSMTSMRRGESATSSQKNFERKNTITQKCCGLTCSTNTKVLVYVLSLLGFALGTGILAYELLNQAPCGCCGWDKTFATSLIMFIFGFWMSPPE